MINYRTDSICARLVCTRQNKSGVKLPHFPILLDSQILRPMAIIFRRTDEQLAGETIISHTRKGALLKALALAEGHTFRHNSDHFHFLSSKFPYERNDIILAADCAYLITPFQKASVTLKYISVP
jgi:hypothetical protein